MQEDTHQLTPDGAELEIEKERRKRAEIEYKLERSKREWSKTVEETRQELFADAFRRQIAATGLQFHPSDAELRTVMETKGTHFAVQSTGAFVVEQNGKQIPFGEAVENFAVQHPFLLTDRSQIAHRLKPQEQLCRADFGNNTAAKAKWIREHSLSEWESLPATREEVVTRENLTKEAYLRASTTQKLKWNLSEREIAVLLHYGTLNGKG